ncbi:hypothetical protein ABZX51_000421 [Aspergillus tubingensis]
MPEADGYMIWQSPNQVEAHFNIDGPDTNQLVGTRTLNGHVGKEDFETSFDNSSKIEGNLAAPIDQNSPFYGSATWSQYM